MLSNETKEEAARHVTGPGSNAAMAWGEGTYYDFEVPNPEIMTLEDYAFALAYSPRFRGQTRNPQTGRRAFYGVGQHLVVGARELIAAEAPAEVVIEWLFHESGEAPFGDLPGPAKSLFPEWRPLEKLHATAINGRFGIPGGHEDEVKRWDIRMFLTERRDLMPGGLGDKSITDGYEPFENVIVPFFHPDAAAIHFLRLCEQFGVGN